jgi:hypothetical protein
MRKYIDILETPLVVYHGGQLTEHYPIFVAPDIEVARSYANDRKGKLYSFVIDTKHMGNQDDVEHAANSLGLNDSSISTSELLSPMRNSDATLIIKELIDRGFNSIMFWDHAMDNDFKEVEAIAVFRPEVLSSPMLVEKLEHIEVKNDYRATKGIDVIVNPSRADLISLARGEAGA